MSGLRVLVAGCGYLGTAAALALAARGHCVFGARRRPARLPASVHPVAVDLLCGDLGALPPALDVIVWALAPALATPAAYRAASRIGPLRLLAFLAARGDPPRRAVLVSSTGVWRDAGGAVVDEATPPDATSPTGRELVDGERAFAGAAPAGSVLLRCGGIYGPGRTWLLDRVRDGLAELPSGRRFTNRIHRDDGASAIAHALELPAPAPCYTVVDDDPADDREVLAFLAHRLGVQLAAGVGPAPPAGKRCSNALLRRTGWAPRWPSFRDGYGAMLAAGPAEAKS